MATNLHMAKLYLNNIEALKNYINKLDPKLKYYDLDKIKEKILDSLDKLSFQLKDLKLSLESRSVFDEHKNVYTVIRSSLNTFTTIEQYATLKSFMGMLSTEKIDDLKTFDMIGAADEYYYQYKNVTIFPRDYHRNLYNAIRNTNGLNIFMPNCFDGSCVSNFAKEKDSTFGNSVSHPGQAKAVMTRVIKGELKGSHITNNFFDAVFLVPPVTYRLTTDHFGKIAEPQEKIFVKNCIKYCRQDGVIYMTLPATRIDASFAFYLSKILSDNTIIVKEPNSSLERVTIIGQKHITQKSKPELYQRLKYIDYDSTPTADTIVPTFDIPTKELTLELFRGSSLDTEDVLEAIQTNLIDSFLENQTQPLVVKDQSPLLPFNIGQVGLVLTSGCLDGVVEEIDGVYHVIKGMTTKLSSTHTEVSENNEQVKSTETVSNQVKINVFTGDGEFISLG